MWLPGRGWEACIGLSESTRRGERRRMPVNHIDAQTGQHLKIYQMEDEGDNNQGS